MPVRSAAAEVPPFKVSIQLEQPLTSAVVAEVLQESIKSLLYARRQIPCLYLDLQKAVQAAEVGVDKMPLTSATDRGMVDATSIKGRSDCDDLFSRKSPVATNPNVCLLA